MNRHDTLLTDFKPSALHAEIAIRYAGKPQDWQNMSYVFAIAYDQKENHAFDLPFLKDVQENYRRFPNSRNTLYYDDASNNNHDNRHFLIASVPPSKVSYHIPDQGLAMAGMCEFKQETVSFNHEYDLKTLFIENLYTIKSKRCPVGKALMLECIEEAEKRQVEAIALNAPFDDSRQWYINEIGFTPFDKAIYRNKESGLMGRNSNALFLHRDNFEQSKAKLLYSSALRPA